MPCARNGLFLSAIVDVLNAQGIPTLRGCKGVATVEPPGRSRPTSAECKGKVRSPAQSRQARPHHAAQTRLAIATPNRGIFRRTMLAVRCASGRRIAGPCSSRREPFLRGPFYRSARVACSPLIARPASLCRGHTSETRPRPIALCTSSTFSCDIAYSDGLTAWTALGYPAASERKVCACSFVAVRTSSSGQSGRLAERGYVEVDAFACDQPIVEGRHVRERDAKGPL